jgi:hypothetical protein
MSAPGKEAAISGRIRVRPLCLRVSDADQRDAIRAEGVGVRKPDKDEPAIREPLLWGFVVFWKREAIVIAPDVIVCRRLHHDFALFGARKLRFQDDANSSACCVYYAERGVYLRVRMRERWPRGVVGGQGRFVCVVPGHDAIIRVGWLERGGPRGCAQRSKVSMMIMRPPQQGQGGR